ARDRERRAPIQTVTESGSGRRPCRRVSTDAPPVLHYGHARLELAKSDELLRHRPEIAVAQEDERHVATGSGPIAHEARWSDDCRRPHRRDAATGEARGRTAGQAVRGEAVIGREHPILIEQRAAASTADRHQTAVPLDVVVDQRAADERLLHRAYRLLRGR